MRTKSLFVAVALALMCAGTGGGAAASATPHVSLSPAVVLLGGRANVLVAGWRGSHLEVALAGATDRRGRLLGWSAASLRNGKWRVELPRPALRGIYPVLLRERAGAPVVRSPHWLLRVFRRGAAQEPTFASAQAVVRWWVRTSPHGTLAALRAWPRSDLDKRDPKLHRIFVVAYNPPGMLGIANRLGRFVTAVREGYGGRFRLLEATVQP